MPRSRRRPRVHAARAGTCGCARSRSPGSACRHARDLAAQRAAHSRSLRTEDPAAICSTYDIGSSPCPGRRFAAPSRTRSRSRASSPSRSSSGSIWTRATARRGGRDVLRSSCVDRPARRLPRAALARRSRGSGRSPTLSPTGSMIGTAAILMLATGRIPILAALDHPRARRRSRPRLPTPVAGRLRARGHRSSGRRRPGCLYASRSASCSSRRRGRPGPLVLLWIGIALSLAAGVQYALRAWRQVQRGRDSRPEREP